MRQIAVLCEFSSDDEPITGYYASQLLARVLICEHEISGGRLGVDVGVICFSKRRKESFKSNKASDTNCLSLGKS